MRLVLLYKHLLLLHITPLPDSTDQLMDRKRRRSTKKVSITELRQCNVLCDTSGLSFQQSNGSGGIGGRIVQSTLRSVQELFIYDILKTLSVRCCIMIRECGRLLWRKFGKTLEQFLVISCVLLESLFLVIFFVGVLILDIGRGSIQIFGYVNKKLQHVRESNIIFFRVNKKLQHVRQSNITFNDVKGVDEAKSKLKEIVQYVRYPERFIGYRPPEGILLVGPPGTGKTMLARAVAREAQVPLFSTTSSKLNEVLFEGLGAKRITNYFSVAKKQSSCVIFIDEIDAIGGNCRPEDSPFTKASFYQFLVEMDGFREKSGTILIAATSFPERLNKALVRPQWFDHRVFVPLPDVKARTQILSSHLSKARRAGNVDLMTIAKGTFGLSGAELANLVNIAVSDAARGNAKQVSMGLLQHAKDIILSVHDGKSTTISKSRLTAMHIAGRVLTSVYTDGAPAVSKVTIVPQETSAGMITYLPDDDIMTFISGKKKLAKLDVYMGAAAADILFLGTSRTLGGSSYFDLKRRANSIAIEMVADYGMTKEHGDALFKHSATFCDYENCSIRNRNLIEKEAKELVENAYNNAHTILTTHKEELHALVNALLEYETLTGIEIENLLYQLNSPKKQCS